jgi:hypothetical protein
LSWSRFAIGFLLKCLRLMIESDGVSETLV